MNHRIFWFKTLHNADKWMRHWNYEMGKLPVMKPNIEKQLISESLKQQGKI
jgi:hypothetical protein